MNLLLRDGKSIWGFLAVSLVPLKSQHVIIHWPHSFWSSRRTQSKRTARTITETSLHIQLELTFLNMTSVLGPGLIPEAKTVPVCWEGCLNVRGRKRVSSLLREPGPCHNLSLTPDQGLRPLPMSPVTGRVLRPD